jgi:hypothetical protein
VSTLVDVPTLAKERSVTAGEGNILHSAVRFSLTSKANSSSLLPGVMIDAEDYRAAEKASDQNKDRHDKQRKSEPHPN